MKANLFEFKSYKTYLLNKFESGSPHGWKSQFARAINCQPAYVARIFANEADLSLEQAWLANEFLGHTKDEANFFILLVQFERAGIPALKTFFSEQLGEIRAKRLILKERLEVKASLGRVNQGVYYSSWHYAAVHVLLTIEPVKTLKAIAEYLNLPKTRVAEALEFLVTTGLVVRKGGAYDIGVSQIHLGTDSPFLLQHHTNWRLRAIDSLGNAKNDLHYSSVASISESDFQKFTELLIQAIESGKKIIKDSPGERLVCFSLDFFGLKSQ